MIKKVFFYCLPILMLIFVTGAIDTQQVLAQANPGVIWTTRGDCGDEQQDVNHYDRGEWVYINGANFNPGIYDWYIEGQPGNASADPNIKVAQGQVTVDSSRAFCFAAYQVAEDDGGEYTVKVGNKGDNYRVRPGTAVVVINYGECTLIDNEYVTPISFIISNAILTINGNSYEEDVTLYLSPGSYFYSWTAKEWNQGSGSGTITIESTCQTDPTPTPTNPPVEDPTPTPTNPPEQDPTPTPTNPPEQDPTPTPISTSTQPVSSTTDPSPTATPMPSMAPTTGPSDQPVSLMIAGGTSLLIAILSFLLWKKNIA